MQMSKESAHTTHPTPTPSVNDLNNEAAEFVSMLEENTQPTQPQNANEQLDANNDADDYMSVMERLNEFKQITNLDTTPKIKYYTRLAVTLAEKPLTITFDNLDKLSPEDFQKGFNESILNEDYVHLYFDFDQIKSTDELDSVFEWLADLTDVFGEYTYGGYTDNKEVAYGYGFRLFPEGNHFVSMHVIFYQTRISTDDLMTIVEKDIKKNHPLVDPAVYKPKSSRQLFRHVLSNKIFRKHDKDGQNKLNYGYLCDNAKPSQHTIQTKGINELIKLNDEEILELLNHFEPEYNTPFTFLQRSRTCIN